MIDESRNFRNAGGQRYQWLMERVFKSGDKNKVLMLSATPVNTSLDNIKNRIDFSAAGDNAAFDKSLGIADVFALIRNYETQFKARMREKHSPPDTKRRPPDTLGGEFIRPMTAVSAARSCKCLKAVYQDDISTVGGGKDTIFPEQPALACAAPPNVPCA